MGNFVLIRIFIFSIFRYEVESVLGAFNKLTYELTIKNVKKSDFGKYECLVKNQEGSGSKIIELIGMYSCEHIHCNFFK